MVGCGLHRMDERRPGETRCFRATSSRSCQASSASTIFGSRRHARHKPLSPPRHGIEAFCYWHYWFAGRRLLERPFQEVLDSGQPASGVLSRMGEPALDDDLDRGPQRPRRADVSRRGDHERHFRRPPSGVSETSATSASTVGRSSSVYRPSDLPDAGRFADQWRRLAAQAKDCPACISSARRRTAGAPRFRALMPRCIPRLYDVYPRAMVPGRLGPRLDRALRRRPKTYPYAALAGVVREPSRLPHPGASDGGVELGQHPALRATRLRAHRIDAPAVRGSAVPCDRQHRTAAARATHTFLKSWNEWAEGNYVEPDRRARDAYLRAVAAAVYGHGTAAHPARSCDRWLVARPHGSGAPTAKHAGAATA